MDNILLDVTEYNGAKAQSIRLAGRIPIIYYGKDIKNRQFSTDYQLFRRAYEKGGRSTIFNLVTETSEKFPVLIQDIQYDPLTDAIRHIDVIAVDLNKPIHTSIRLVFTGTAPAVKELGGIFMHNKDSVAVECLPKDLIHEIKVDISPLVDFHASITIGDLQVPAAIKILDAPEINVATVSAPRMETEVEKPVAVAPEATAEKTTGATDKADKKESTESPGKKG